MLVSPAEPAAVRALGRTSMVPERFGFDVMWWAAGARVGVQRKEVKDLRASVDDGRLAKELRQAECAAVSRKVLIVEGSVRFDDQGRMQGRYTGRWTRAMWNGVLWGMWNAGWWVHPTANIRETCEALEMLEKWTQKERHGSLAARASKVPSIWGTRPSDREYATWVLEGIDGVGAELAGRIYDTFGGLPVQWAEGVDEQWMEMVPGIGKIKARKIMRGLDRRAR